MRLDATGMMIIVIREYLKKLDKQVSPEFFEEYPKVDWKGAKGMRDILSHEYFLLEKRIIFDVAKNKIPILITTIEQ